MNNGNLLREIPGISVTAARYGIAEHMAHKVRDEEAITVDMKMFIAADIADGKALRSFDMDTPVRRIADGIVDHLSAARVAREVAKKNPAAKPYIGILATRAAVVGSLNLAHLVNTGEVTKGRFNQKATNLATAAFTIAATSGNRAATHITGVLASGIALATAPRHLKGLGQKHSEGFREL